MLAIFDFDGTICDTKDSIFHVIDLTYTSINKHVPRSIIIDTLKLGCTLEETFSKINSELGFDLDEGSLVVKYRDIYNRDAYIYTNIYSGIAELLKFLSNNGIPILILSNKGSKSINKILEANDLSEYITEVIGADSCEFKKPDSRLFSDIILLKYPSINIEKTYVIGDTTTDINFAKNSNLKSCFVKYGYGNVEDCLHLKPDFVINTCNDLNKIKRLFLK